jgi:SAM-dependent methyltransferase
MEYRGSQFYDDDLSFGRYLERRKWNENANDTIERPIIMELIGDVTGKTVLDLGCGAAAFGNELIDLGAASYTGIEGSSNMVEASKKTLSRNNAQVIHTTMEEWPFPRDRFELVVSRLALHYIKDLEALFRKISDSLVSGGTLIFSVEHPVMTSSYGFVKLEGFRQDWIVDTYFHTGTREQEWLGGVAIKYHITIEDYYSCLQRAGFLIESLRESKPLREHFLNEETYQRRMRIPLFLFFKAIKK